MCEDNAISVLWEILLVLRLCVCVYVWAVSVRMCGFLEEPQIWANEGVTTTPGQKE